MEIFLVILGILIILFILFCVTDIKVYVEFDNVSACNVLKIKAYIFSRKSLLSSISASLIETDVTDRLSYVL